MIRRPRHSGFTLLELILTTAMVAMLAASLYGSLRIAYNARNAANRAVASIRSGQITLDLLRQDLDCALPPTGLLAGPFQGTFSSDAGFQASAIEFYAVGSGMLTNPDPTQQGGIHRINFLVLAGQDGSPVLVRRTWRNLLAQVQDDPDDEILCRGVRAFALRYFDGLTWLEEWDSTQMNDMLPIAVEINLELERIPGDSSPENLYRVSRILFLPCHTDTSATQTTGGAP